jgi:hypothetical protein
MPYPPGTLVTWNADAPDTWHYIYTPGPMRVIDSFYHTGDASDYAKQFHPEGMGIKPGWIYTVDYDPDSTSYYDPPLRLLYGPLLKRMVHERWIVPL